MTLLAVIDRSAICRIRLTGEGRWVCLALSLGDLAPGTRFLVNSERLSYEMAGVDEGTREYGLSNWQGGVISGARYAFRALKAPTRQIILHELSGRLGSGDVGAVSSAAALAVARLLVRSPEFPLDLGGWAIEEEIRSPQSAEDTSRSPEVVVPQPGQPPERAESGAPDPGKSDTNGGTQALPAEPGVPADRPHG